MFLINSRLGRFAATASSSHREGWSPGAALLLPKLRSQYAEFLNHGSPDRLGMLYPPTCVGFGTGTRSVSLGVFLGSMGSLTSLGASSRVSGTWCADLPTHRPTRFHGDVQNPAQLPFSVTPSSSDVWWYRNVNLLCIGYACRPRLSSRLTLGGLALPRNP